jgi:polyisoprenoid-binding protein YceI
VGIWQVLGIVAVAAVAVSAGYLTFSGDGLAGDLRAALHRRITWLVGVPALAVVFLVGVPYVYLQAVTDPPPPPMTFADLPEMPTTSTTAPPAATITTTTTTTVVTELAAVAGAPATPAGPTTTVGTTTTLTAADRLAGAWRVGVGSQARYGIDDTVIGQTQRVVGSTDKVTGQMEVGGRRVTSAKVTVDMRSVRCGCVHDDKYQDLLDTDRYPTSTFELTTPIDLGDVPPEGQPVNRPVTGSLTIHGVTHTVTFTLRALRQSDRIAINGTIPIRLEDYNIERPDAGAFGGINNATIDLLIAFYRI